MTSKEALIYLLNMAKNPRCSMIVNESGKYTKEELLNIVNQDLANYEVLKEEHNKTIKSSYNLTKNLQEINKELEEENTKLKKAFDIIKNKNVNVGLLLRQSLFGYNFIKPKDKLTQEEYELLKEVFSVEKED